MQDYTFDYSPISGVEKLSVGNVILIGRFISGSNQRRVVLCETIGQFIPDINVVKDPFIYGFRVTKVKKS